MRTMSDIVERLSGYNPPDRTVDDQRQIAQDILDARAEIARLTAEVERLRADRESIEEFSHAKSDMISKMDAVVDAARAECNRILDIMGANAYDNGLRNAARSILRALDGEP